VRTLIDHGDRTSSQRHVPLNDPTTIGALVDVPPEDAGRDDGGGLEPLFESLQVRTVPEGRSSPAPVIGSKSHSTPDTPTGKDARLCHQLPGRAILPIPGDRASSRTHLGTVGCGAAGGGPATTVTHGARRHRPGRQRASTGRRRMRVVDHRCSPCPGKEVRRRQSGNVSGFGC
jgi:hypothetical protein